MTSPDISNIAIILAVQGVDCHCIIYGVRKSDEILYLMILEIYQIYLTEINMKKQNYYFDNFIKGKKLETKSVLIDKKNYKDLAI